MKMVDVLKEVGAKHGIADVEKLIMDAFAILEECAPRFIVETEDGKTVGTVMGVALPAVKPLVEKAADLNHDGKIG